MIAEVILFLTSCVFLFISPHGNGEILSLLFACVLVHLGHISKTAEPI